LDGGVDAVADADEEDASPDAADDASEEAGPDASEEAGQDASNDVTTDVSADVATDAPDAPDAPDASTRPAGQCKADSECSGPTAACSMSAPGGICLGCGSDSDCGNPLEFECFASTCRRICANDEDCPEGLRCAANKYCNLVSCSATCAPPYVCSNGFCRRPQCAGTPPVCPTGMTCGQDNYCVESNL
jgi:hypothetical protein